MSLESRKFWKQCTNLNKNIQLENKVRIDNAEDFKKRTIWNSHSNLQEKNEKKNTNYRLNQCNVRTQSIYERKRKEHTYDFLNSLMKADPNKKEQREKLMKSLHDLNSIMEFGLDLKFPPEIMEELVRASKR